MHVSYPSPVHMLSHLIFPHTSSPLLLFPSMSFHIFYSAFAAHHRDSPEVEDNPCSEQQVFYVLGRHTGQSAASSFSSLLIPRSASKPCCLPLSLYFLMFVLLNMFFHYKTHFFCQGCNYHYQPVFTQHQQNKNTTSRMHLEVLERNLPLTDSMHLCMLCMFSKAPSQGYFTRM